MRAPNRLAEMHRLASKLLEWKGIYDSLDVAQTALVAAIRDAAADPEIDALRLKVTKLRASSDAALKELDERVAAFRLSRTPRQ
jgi:hypothetical protein